MAHVERLAPFAEWLRQLVSSTLNHLIIAPLRVRALVGPCESCQVLLADGQIIFLWDLPFSSHLMIDLAQFEGKN